MRIIFNNIKKIFALSKISHFEKIKIIFYSSFLSILDLFSIGIISVIFTKVFLLENIKLELSFFNSAINIDASILIFWLFFSVIFKFIATLFINNEIFKISNQKQLNLRMELINLFSKINFLNFQEKSPNLYISLLGNHTKTYGTILAQTFIFFGEILFLIFLIIILCVINFKITFFLLIFFSFLILIFFSLNIFNPQIVGVNNKEAYKDLYNFIINFFSSFKEIKIYDKFDNINLNLKNFSKIIQYSELKIKLIAILPKLFIELIISLLLALVLFLTIKFNLSIFSNIEYFGILMASIIRLMPLITNILRYNNEIKYSGSFIDEINQNIDFLIKNQSQSKKFVNLENDNFDKISLKNINFSYQDKDILKSAAIDIEINKFTSISGESGSGKTTLLNVICGFLNPKNIQLYIDDKLIDANESISNLIAYVPQDKFLFQGEVWKNVSLEYKKENCDLAKIDYVLSLVKFNGDKNMLLSSGAQNLSGGQKQRIIIARALYFSKKIIILDESTNELDINSEKNILNDIKKIKNIAVLLVSHKNSVLQFSDVKYRLNDKKIYRES